MNTDLKPEKTNVSAIILAGGQGQRVQGKDKGLQLWQEKPLIQHVIDRIRPQVSDIVISANRNLERYQALGFPVVRDRNPDFSGPLAGIDACKSHCAGSLVLVVACDTPLLPENLVEKLYTSIISNGLQASYAHDGQRDHYLCCLVRSSGLDSINERISRGQRSVKGWLAALSAQPTHFKNSDNAFLNLNSQI